MKIYFIAHSIAMVVLGSICGLLFGWENAAFFALGYISSAILVTWALSWFP